MKSIRNRCEACLHRRFNRFAISEERQKPSRDNGERKGVWHGAYVPDAKVKLHESVLTIWSMTCCVVCAKSSGYRPDCVSGLFFQNPAYNLRVQFTML